MDVITRQKTRGRLCLETGRCSLTLLASLNAVAPLLHGLLSLFTLPSSSGVYLPRRLRLGVAGLGLGLWLIAYYQVISLPLKIDGRAAGSHASYCRWLTVVACRPIWAVPPPPTSTGCRASCSGCGSLAPQAGWRAASCQSWAACCGSPRSRWGACLITRAD